MHALVIGGQVMQLWAERPVLHPDMLVVEVPAGQAVQEGWTWDGAAFAPPPPPPAPRRQLAPLGFFDLFTAEEERAISAAAMQSPAVFLWFNRATAARYVDLDAPRTVEGLQALAAAGLIAEARVAEILAGIPPTGSGA